MKFFDTTFYEEFKDEEKSIDIHRNNYHVYPAHFHQRVEMLIVNRGDYTISINNKIYHVTDGMIAVFDSYDIHNYLMCNKSETDDCVLIFPVYLLNDYFEYKKENTLTKQVFHSPVLCDKILEFVDHNRDIETQNRLLKQAFIDTVMGWLLNEIGLSKTTPLPNDHMLILNILKYMEQNFQSPLSLKILSSQFGYCEEYISRVFHRYVNEGFNRYLKRLRLQFILSESKKRKVNKTELIYQAGFNSLQTYYRALREFQLE